MTDDPATRQVPAPELEEVARTWWDADVVPVVTWDREGRAFDLVHPAAPQDRLELLRLPAPAADPGAVARVLAEGLAACDFPPTGEAAAPGRVRATLEAAGIRL